MADLRETQKEQALKRMKILGIMEQPVKEFKEEGKVNLSENGGILYWLNDDEQKIVDDFEKQHNGLVYHVIKSYTNIGLLYALLYVSEYTEEWEMDLADLGAGQALAYVINMDMPDCSEFGTIGIKPLNGGLARTW